MGKRSRLRREEAAQAEVTRATADLRARLVTAEANYEAERLMRSAEAEVRRVRDTASSDRERMHLEIIGERRRLVDGAKAEAAAIRAEAIREGSVLVRSLGQERDRILDAAQREAHTILRNARELAQAQTNRALSDPRRRVASEPPSVEDNRQPDAAQMRAGPSTFRELRDALPQPPHEQSSSTS